jgi:hypothetical protein
MAGRIRTRRIKKPLKEGDPVWDMLAQQNNFDLQLYGCIEELFVEQNVLMRDCQIIFGMSTRRIASAIRRRIHRKRFRVPAGGEE